MEKVQVRDLFTVDEVKEFVDIFVKYTFQSPNLQGDEAFDKMLEECTNLVSPKMESILQKKPDATITMVVGSMLECLTESSWKKIASGEIKFNEVGEA